MFLPLCKATLTGCCSFISFDHEDIRVVSMFLSSLSKSIPEMSYSPNILQYIMWLCKMYFWTVPHILNVLSCRCSTDCYVPLPFYFSYSSDMKVKAALQHRHSQPCCRAYDWCILGGETWNKHQNNVWDTERKSFLAFLSLPLGKRVQWSCLEFTKTLKRNWAIDKRRSERQRLKRGDRQIKT